MTAVNKDLQNQLNNNLMLFKKKAFDVKFDLDGTLYKSIENIGSGAYGVVCSASVQGNSEKVAIKKISNVFELLTSAKRTYRELKILKHFNHSNIIMIKDILLPKNRENFVDVYVVFDLMESDLHRIISSKQPITEDHVRYFVYQIFCGLAYIHSAGVIHRDIKPSNLLINSNCHLRIGDFGMSRGVDPNYGADDVARYNLTQYVATRWYRAPELIMGHVTYSSAVDLWSVGCILVELMIRKPIFPGKDLMHQLRLILERLGSPPRSFMDCICSDGIRGIVRGLALKSDPPPLAIQFLKVCNKKSADLLTHLLVYDPDKRLTARQALSHHFLNKYRNPSREMTCQHMFDFSFETKLDTREKLQSAIYEEILHFHPEVIVATSTSPHIVARVDQVDDAFTKNNESQSKCTVESLVQSQLEKPTVWNETVAVTISDHSYASITPAAKYVAAPNSTTLYKFGAVMQSSTVATADVDMLSARNSARNVVEMLSASTSDTCHTTTSAATAQKTSCIGGTRAVSLRASVQFKQKKKTISEDTKVVLKAAILSHHRDKNDAPKPTAALRQREREAKRHLRLERARERRRQERIKRTETCAMTAGRSNSVESSAFRSSETLARQVDVKTMTHCKKEVETVEQRLSCEDKQLLARWQKLQKGGGGNCSSDVIASMNIKESLAESDLIEPFLQASVFTHLSTEDNFSLDDQLSADLHHRLAITDPSNESIPYLSHTPRGSGHGYGLNFDLGDLFETSNLVSAGPEPDSAEAMAAWLDICQGVTVNQDDLNKLVADANLTV